MKVKIAVLKHILVPGFAEIEISDEWSKDPRLKTYVVRRARRAFERGELPVEWQTEESVEGEYRFTCIDKI